MISAWSIAVSDQELLAIAVLSKRQIRNRKVEGKDISHHTDSKVGNYFYFNYQCCQPFFTVKYGDLFVQIAHNRESRCSSR